MQNDVPEIRYDMDSGDFLKLDMESAERVVYLSIIWQYRNDEIKFAGSEDRPDFFESLTDRTYAAVEHTLTNDNTYANDWK